MNFEFMNELLKTAKEYDVTICLENMPMHNFSMSKPSEILKFVKTINDDHFKICLDTEYVAVFDDLSIGDVVRTLGEEIRILHVHDNVKNMDLHLLPGLGVIDWDEVVKALREINFEGVFSLEILPSEKLTSEMFDKMCKIFADVAKDLIAIK